MEKIQIINPPATMNVRVETVVPGKPSAPELQSCPACRGEGKVRTLPPPPPKPKISRVRTFFRAINIVWDDLVSFFFEGPHREEFFPIFSWFVIVVWTIVGLIIGGFALWADEKNQAPHSAFLFFTYPALIGWGTLALFGAGRWLASAYRRALSK